MKKLVLFLILLSALSFAQSTTDISNSTTTTLDSAGVYTGGQSLIPRNYSSILIQVYSDKASATNGVEIQFTNDKVNYDKRVFWSYTAGDTTSNFTCPVMGLYYRVKYTNGADSQTVFRLSTVWLQNYIPKVNQKGELITATTLITHADSLVAADTVSYNFGNATLFGELNLRNAGADADTVIVEYWDMFNSAWTSDMNGLKDSKSNDFEADNTLIIITNGKTKRWLINEPFPGLVRIRNKVNTGQANDKIYIGFIGKSGN